MIFSFMPPVVANRLPSARHGRIKTKATGYSYAIFNIWARPLNFPVIGDNIPFKPPI